MRKHDQETLNTWMTAAEQRHLADLRIQEVSRALRALSSAYVERRSQGHGTRVHGALDTAGKRAAFALYYAPLHFIAVSEAVHALGLTEPPPDAIVDLGCGTGAAGAAWSLAAGSASTVLGIDRHPWAVAEARWTFSQLGLRGIARQGAIERLRSPHTGESAVAAYTLNELPDSARQRVEQQLLERARRGGRVLIVEPLARAVVPWWDDLARRLAALGGRTDEWKLPVEVPPIARELGTAAGLNYRELRFQTLSL